MHIGIFATPEAARAAYLTAKGRFPDATPDLASKELRHYAGGAGDIRMPDEAERDRK